MSKPILNREQWLHAFTDAVRPWFAAEGFEIPGSVKLSCGFPSRGALSERKRVIGQCWDAIVSSAGHWEIFISPMIYTTLEVAATSVHELLHAVLQGRNKNTKHGPAFAKAARAMLLDGKPTATFASEAFAAKIQPIIEKLGEYPHAQMVPNPDQKPQSTRMVKVLCGNCGYIARVTRKWIDGVGAPLCPGSECDAAQMEEA